jgi:hypothetical protein
LTNEFTFAAAASLLHGHPVTLTLEVEGEKISQYEHRWETSALEPRDFSAQVVSLMAAPRP